MLTIPLIYNQKVTHFTTFRTIILVAIVFIKNNEFWITNGITNDGFCITNDGFCITNDEFETNG